MSPGTSANLVIDVASVAVGASGLLLATLANKRAKDANRLAQEANDLAAQGVAQAEEANRVAVEGNHIASDANTVAERALAATTDHVQYQWRIKSEGDPFTLTVINDSAHLARDVTVVADYRRHVVATGSADVVPPFGELTLHLDHAVQEQVERASQHGPYAHTARVTKVGTIRRVYVRVTVTATTEAGVTRSDVFNQGLTMRQGQVKTHRGKH